MGVLFGYQHYKLGYAKILVCKEYRIMEFREEENIRRGSFVNPKFLTTGFGGKVESNVINKAIINC